MQVSVMENIGIHCSENGNEESGITKHLDSNNIGNSSSSTSAKEIRKHRYAFQTRSQLDILDDGYRWRKYGQKIVKNSKFPRSYYKCTQNGCNVKKQIQRSTKDEGIVVTTYEGVHTHPTPIMSTDNFEDIIKQMQTHTLLSSNYAQTSSHV